MPCGCRSSDPTSPSGICFETEISKGETLIDVGHMEEGMEMLARALSLAERLHGPEDERVRGALALGQRQHTQQGEVGYVTRYLHLVYLKVFYVHCSGAT